MAGLRSVEVFKRLRARAKSFLHEFNASSASFRLIQSVPDAAPSACRTLYVLDSSFNPPSNAHFHLAKNAIIRGKCESPVRLLLLLSTTNADKAPKPAAFEDRIAMMVLMAQTLSDTTNGVPIDVGVTKLPMFMDKAKAIDDSGICGDITQVHLAGFDTLTRIFDTKYYPAKEKLSVLDPFLRKHRLRINYRLEDQFGSREEQDRYVRSLFDGSHDDKGVRMAWRDRIEMADDAQDGVGISSTKAREAVTKGDGARLDDLVDHAVGQYIRELDLYLEHDGEA